MSGLFVVLLWSSYFYFYHLCSEHINEFLRTPKQGKTIMRNYRGKAQITPNDFSHLPAGEFYKQIKILGLNVASAELKQFYTAVLVKMETKAKPGSDEYKRVYARVNARLQYRKKLGQVVNIRYGVWQIVTE